MTEPAGVDPEEPPVAPEAEVAEPDEVPAGIPVEQTARSSRNGRQRGQAPSPIRRCAGCGRRAPQRELLRFAARDGELVPGRREPGRGAYTCRDASCFERALERRGFAHALRTNVHIDPALARLYTEGAHGQRR